MYIAPLFFFFSFVLILPLSIQACFNSFSDFFLYSSWFSKKKKSSSRHNKILQQFDHVIELRTIIKSIDQAIVFRLSKKKQISLSIYLF